MHRITHVALLAAWPAALVLAAGCSSDTGPDAGTIADDPLLHVDVPDSEPGDVDAETGKEGGVAPALGNPDSMAARSWQLTTDDWQPVLVATLELADELGVVLWGLDCHGDDVVVDGAKEVDVGDDSAVMATRLTVRTGEQPVELRWRLDSGEGLRLDSPPAHLADQPVDPDCPPVVVDAFEHTRN